GSAAGARHQAGGPGRPATKPRTAGPPPGAPPLRYDPPQLYVCQFPAARRPRHQSHHGLDGRRRKRRLSTWLRPTTALSLAVPYSTAAAAAKPPRPRRSAPQAAPQHLATPHHSFKSGSSLQHGGRGSKATTASTVGAASGASALGYAPPQL